MNFIISFHAKMQRGKDAETQKTFYFSQRRRDAENFLFPADMNSHTLFHAKTQRGKELFIFRRDAENFLFPAETQRKKFNSLYKL